MAVATAGRPTADIGVTRTATGTASMTTGQTVDLCEASGEGSCPIELSAGVSTSLSVSLDFSAGTPFLNPGARAAVNGSIASVGGSSVLDFNFTRGTRSYVYSPSAATPHAIGESSTASFSIPVGALTKALGLPSVSVNATFDASEVLNVSGTLLGSGFAGATLIHWETSESGADIPFAGGTPTASLQLGGLSATQKWGLSMAVNSSSGSQVLFNVSAADVASSQGESGLFSWYGVSVESAYASPAGAGWYIAGSSANVSVSQETADAGATTRVALAGWNGTGRGSYTGPAQIASITVASPISEVAIWQTQYLIGVPHNAGGTVYSPLGVALNQVPTAFWVPSGYSLSLQAVSDPGFVFRGWSVNGTVTESASTFFTETVGGPTTVGAVFAEIQGQSTTAASTGGAAVPLSPLLLVAGTVVLFAAAGLAVMLRRSRRRAETNTPATAQTGTPGPTRGASNSVKCDHLVAYI